MRQKKGALELSVNTIIIIVIGVTLLSLGLVFVRGIFQKVEGLSKEAFERAEAQLGEISDVSKELSIIPENIDVEQGGAETTKVILANFGEQTIQVSATASSTDTNIDCSFADTLRPTSNPYSLGSGQQATITLIVDEKGGALGIKVCNIVGNGLSGDNREELVISVVKK